MSYYIDKKIGLNEYRGVWYYGRTYVHVWETPEKLYYSLTRAPDESEPEEPVLHYWCRSDPLNHPLKHGGWKQVTQPVPDEELWV